MSSHKLQMACAPEVDGAIFFFEVHRLLVAEIFGEAVRYGLTLSPMQRNREFHYFRF